MIDVWYIVYYTKLQPIRSIPVLSVKEKNHPRHLLTQGRLTQGGHCGSFFLRGKPQCFDVRLSAGSSFGEGELVGVTHHLLSILCGSKFSVCMDLGLVTS